ncbi:MAG: radical SAM protein [Chitinispirillaceae bacterium]|nr:radical SAM protein [Chitinispirillaceae bacterium]
MITIAGVLLFHNIRCHGVIGLSIPAVIHYLVTKPHYLFSLLHYKFKLYGRYKWIDSFAASKKAVPAPLTYKIILTERCNLRCKMCMNITDRTKTDTETSKRQIDYTLLEKILTSKSVQTRNLILSGGEPMLYSRFGDLINLLEYLKINTTICTNGTVLHKYIHLLKKSRYIHLTISLDGLRDANDSIRGAGVYDKVLAAIKQMRMESGNIYIGIQHTIRPENVHSMFDFCKEMVKLKIDWILLNPNWYMSQKTAEAYSTVIRNEFNTVPHSQNGYIMEYNLDHGAFSREYLKIKSEKWPIQISCYYNDPINDMKNMISNENYFCGNRFCYKQWIRMDISVEGNVVSCQQFPDIIIGDLNYSNWNEIWNSDVFNHFRNVIIKKPLPVCNRCAPIYLYDRKRMHL